MHYADKWCVYLTTFVGITTVWTTFPRGCQSSFSQEYRIICKNARFVFLFATNTANLSAWLLSYKLEEYKSKLSHTITSQAKLRHCNMKTGSPSWDTESSEHVSDIGSHSRWVGCHNTLFRQLIPFLQGVLQPSYQFSSWGGNSVGGINPLTLGQPQEVGYIICVKEAEAGGAKEAGIALNGMSWEEQGNTNDRATECTKTRHRVLPSRVWVPALVHALSRALSPHGCEHVDLLTVWFVSDTSCSFLGHRVHTYASPPMPHCPELALPHRTCS